MYKTKKIAKSSIKYIYMDSRLMLTILFLFCQHPPLKGVLKYMSEAIISRRGGGGSSGGELRTETIAMNTQWVVPKGIKGNVSVRIFGGGAAGIGSSVRGGAGGGSGWMNNGEFKLSAGQTIPITIGIGSDNHTNAGGTTSFGEFLSANGGLQTNGGAGGGDVYNSNGGIGYQFGGGGGGGGDGGIWGGGGGATSFGGNGGTYGGGGGAGGFKEDNFNMSSGNGGLYGGGGGLALVMNRRKGDTSNAIRGIGGQYGGAGSLILYNFNKAIYNQLGGSHGIDTSSWTNVISMNGVFLRGGGRCVAPSTGGGGGGFGGNGGTGSLEPADRFGGGGGGGYGSDGGNNHGGGGGFGGKGGDNYGGGGGYGPEARGGDMYGGGGGYFSKGGTRYGGGGGYGPGGGDKTTSNMPSVGRHGKFGGGGCGSDTTNVFGIGGDGICILQYYT